MLKISRQRYDFLSHNRQGARAGFVNSVQCINELVEIGAVRDIRRSPVVSVVDGLEDDGAAAVSDYETVTFGLFNAFDDEDIILNIQGDEPLMEPEVMEKAILPFFDNPELQVSNLMTKINDPVDVVNFTVPKVITNNEGIGIYLTRSTAPYPKGSIDYAYYKQVCVYGFTPAALKFYCDYGKKYGKAKIEAIEDIEILRFIENGYKVQYIEVDSETVAVDTPNDLKKVNEIMAAKLK